MGCCDDPDRVRMSANDIVKNVMFSSLVLLCILLAVIGVATYEWVQTDAAEMELSNPAAFSGGTGSPIGVPNFQKISCGVTSYCLEASNTASECTLPWPLIGGSIHPGNPSTLWKAAAGLIIFACVLEVITFGYTLISCFGFYSPKRQKCFSSFMSFGAFFMFVGLLCWGSSFGEYGYLDPSEDPVYAGIVWPSTAIMDARGTSQDVGCRVCPSESSAFEIGDTCNIGWGAYFVVASCVLSLITGMIGHCVAVKQVITG